MKCAVLALYRVRGILILGPMFILVSMALFGRCFSGATAQQLKPLLADAALGGWAVALLLVVVGPRLLPKAAAHVVGPPVRGRWLAMNSPATKVPSHGIRAYGQAYAIDLVHEPGGSVRPAFGSGAAMRPNTDYPAFGQPVFSMIDGVVVKSSDWRRDHRARSTTLGVLYMMAEGSVREMGGPGFVVGNHITIRGDSGVYALVAHLKQGSAQVRVGDAVRAGDVIGRCGNSGNSSEPHVHAQLMDRSSPFIAQGLPLAFSRVVLGGEADLRGDAETVDGVPANGQHMSAG